MLVKRSCNGIDMTKPLDVPGHHLQCLADAA
ncbi:hypothetical protein ACVWWD_000872 [Mesorhizobium sp. URHB0026]|jgi:hypothetical protein|nr:hypothetical protein X739_20215 [Mesorhizobium sp. LNHC220B00]ESY96719.1 hypothetical protein X741_07320 [Mesorhizobium sp. LNHC229A00]ESY98094.1 hypothetical protein X738_19155 [Mesorhizobium sp. LNHC209A00]